MESQSNVIPTRLIAALGEVHGLLAQVRANPHLMTARELTAVAREVLAIMQIAESSATELATAAIERGVVHSSTAGNAKQWIERLAAGASLSSLLADDEMRGHGPLVHDDHIEPGAGGVDECVRQDLAAAEVVLADLAPHAVPGIEPAHAGRLAAVAAACTLSRNDVVHDALLCDRVNPQTVKTAVREVDAIMHVLPGATREEVFEHFLALGPGVTSRDVRDLSHRLLFRYGDEQQLEDADAAMAAAERVDFTELPNGLTRLEADLSPVNVAVLRQAINALASPAPPNTCCDNLFHRHTGDPTGARDERSAAKRRADALMLLVRTAAGWVDGDAQVATSGRATLVVTLDYETLAGRLVEAVGDRGSRGFGTAETGDILPPGALRQLACDADIIPMVLGGRGQPMDVGRKRRLVTNELRAAVVQRDRHCTFPGCDRPPGWCQAHHVIPWHSGGATSLLNSALLCQRHHTIVHRDGYTATVTAEHVTWDLRRGRMTKST